LQQRIAGHSCRACLPLSCLRGWLLHRWWSSWLDLLKAGKQSLLQQSLLILVNIHLVPVVGRIRPSLVRHTAAAGSRETLCCSALASLAAQMAVKGTRQ
jgi:hypothetical protein